MRVSEPPLEGEVFAKVQLEGCADVADVVVRACKEFPRWGVDAGQVRLFLAAAGGKNAPPPEALVAAAADPASCLGVGWTLDDAGIAPGCWLLARVPPPAAAPGAFLFARLQGASAPVNPPRSPPASQQPSKPSSPR